MSSKRTIAVIGATGVQGGSVVQTFLSRPDWKVRGITRNTQSDVAKGLVAQGAEVVAANLDDEASLVKAFEGADVVFGVTNWWENFATNGFDPNAAGEREYTQALNLANAAAKTATLAHYVFSTVEIETNPKLFVPHIDYKADANKYIKENMKDLTAKTTFLMLSYYPSNIATIPMLKPIPTSPYSPDIQLLSVPQSLLIPSAGDVNVNTGIITSTIVDKPQQTLPGKYVVLQTDFISLGDQTKLWSEITGKPTVSVQTDRETYVQVWGPYGVELDLNMRLFMHLPAEGFNGIPNVLTAETLGISDKLHNTRKTLETIHAKSQDVKG